MSGFRVITILLSFETAAPDKKLPFFSKNLNLVLNVVFTSFLTHTNLPKTSGDHSENFDFLILWCLNLDFFEFSGISKFTILEDLDPLAMGDQ